VFIFIAEAQPIFAFMAKLVQVESNTK